MVDQAEVLRLALRYFNAIQSNLARPTRLKALWFLQAAHEHFEFGESHAAVLRSLRRSEAQLAAICS